MSTLSFHFHGYQPGDIVGLPEPDPLRPQRIEERHSPVGGPAGRPLASRGLLLPRDDGQLPGIDAAGEPRPGRSGELVSGGLPGRGRSSAGSTPGTRSSVDSPRNRGPPPGDSP